MKKATREWVRKAEADFRGALRLASAPEPFHDLIAFHCQQSSEKYLKAPPSAAPTPQEHMTAINTCQKEL